MWKIVVYDVENWIRLGFHWRILGIYTALAATTLLSTWPPAQPITSIVPPDTMRWYVSVQVLIVWYVTAMLAAEAFPWHHPNAARPGHWVRFNMAGPAQVISGKLIGVGLFVFAMVLITLPISVLAVLPFATSTSSWLIPTWVGALGVMFWALTGLGVSTAFASQKRRMIVIQSIFFTMTIAMLLSGMVGFNHLGASLNPLYIIDRATRAVPVVVHTNPSAQVGAFFFYILNVVVAMLVAVLLLRRVPRSQIPQQENNSQTTSSG